MLPVFVPAQGFVKEVIAAVRGVMIASAGNVPHLGAILDGSSGHCLLVLSAASVQAR